MPLFQQSVLNKYLGELNKEQVLQAYQSFQSHFHDPAKQANILQAKEEQYQEGFLSELFGGILGYTLYPRPQYNIKTEQKNLS
jgi:hypothetical protein